MKITLELDDFRFYTTRNDIQAEVRWLVVDIGGKPFSVWQQRDLYHWPTPERDDHFNRVLIEKMQRILAKIMTDACASLPDDKTFPEEFGQ